MAKVGDVLVAFRADVAQFTRSMRTVNERTAAAVGRLRQAARAAAGPFTAAFTGVSRVIGNVTRQMVAFAAAFVGPLAAIFAMQRATRAAVDFEASLTKIITLVGVAREQVNRWRDALLRIGPATGVGPQALADAMFVVTSAGERGAAALDIVTKAAMGTAVGLGETDTIARSVTAAMQAYRRSGLTAAQATDIMAATVREGNLEAASLAGSLGRVLGVAAEAGVTFDQVGAFIATFTRVGVSAEEAVTSLRGTINLLIKPTQQTRKALAEMGIEVANVRRSIRERGLAQTLVELIPILAKNEEAIGNVFPNVRALAGILATASAQGEQFVDISNKIANSQGLLAGAFQEVQQTARFQLDQFRAQMQRLAIVVGDILVPGILRSRRAIGRFADTLAANKDAVRAWADVIVAAGKTFVTVFAGMVRVAFNWGQILGNILRGIGQTLIGVVTFDLERMKEGFATAVEAISTDLEDILTTFKGVADNFVNLSNAAAAAWQTGWQEAAANTITGLEEIEEAASNTLGIVQDRVKAIAGQTVPRWTAEMIKLRDKWREFLVGADLIKLRQQLLEVAELLRVGLLDPQQAREIVQKLLQAFAEARGFAGQMRAFGQRIGQDVVEGLVSAILRGGDRIGEALKRVLLSALEGFVNEAIRRGILDKLFKRDRDGGGLFGALLDVGKVVASVLPGPQQLPALIAAGSEALVAQRGGLVRAPRGTAVPAVLHGGERVIPAEAETTIVINMAAEPVNPFVAARDAQWQAVIAETADALLERGFRFEVRS